MGSEWPRVVIADVCELIVDCVNKTAPVVGGPTPFKMIRTPNVKNGVVNTDTCRFVEAETFEKWTRRASVKIGDVLLTREAPLGEVGIVTSGENLFLGQRLMQYRANPELLDSKFLLYSFLSHDLQHQFSMHEGSGSVVSHIRVGDCLKFELSLPPLNEQKKISQALGSIDQKIQLNRETNKTLEAMAQALFKSWFVDFDPVFDNIIAHNLAHNNAPLHNIPEPLLPHAQRRLNVHNEGQHNADNVERGSARQISAARAFHHLFPQAFEQSDEPSVGIQGWVPKGWGVTNIDGATSIIIDHRGKTPKKMGADWAESGYPAISAKNIKGGKIVRSDTIRFVDDELYKKWMKSPLQPGDIALTSEAPMGELFYFANKHDYLLSQRLYGLRADPQICSGSFLYFWLRTEGAWSDMEGRSTGTTVLGIRQSELRKVAVLKSDKNIIGEFSEIAESYLKQIEGNSLQVRNLESLRDTLLPKLISGELRIPDAEQATEALAK